MAVSSAPSEPSLAVLTGNRHASREAHRAFGLTVMVIDGEPILVNAEAQQELTEPESEESVIHRTVQEYTTQRRSLKGRAAGKVTYRAPISTPPAKRQLRSDTRTDTAKTSNPGSQLAKARREAVSYGHGVSTRRRGCGYRGLYADRSFGKGQYITRYDGVRKTLTLKQIKAVRSSPDKWTHMVTLCDKRKEVIFGLKKPVVGKGAGSFANDGGTSELSNVNAELLVVASKHVYIRAIKDIEEDEEILINYKDDHWTLAKKHHPDLHEAVFKKQIRTHKRLKSILGTRRTIPPRDKLKLPLKKLSDTPVPSMPEIKKELQGRDWNNEFLRYFAASRSGRKDLLNMKCLRLLKPKSQAFFNSVQEYCKTLKFSKTMRFPNHFLDPLYGIPFAPGTIFRPALKWQKQHINYFCWKTRNSTFILSKNNITSMLKVITLESTEYSALLMEYMQLVFGPLKPGQCLDLVTEEQTKRLSHLVSNLNASKTELPPELTREPYHFSGWSNDAAKTFLSLQGIGVIHEKKKRGRTQHSILGRAALKNDTTGYYATLRGITEQSSSSYSSLAYLQKHRGKPLQRLPDATTGIHFNEDCPGAYWFAVDAMGSGVTEGILKKVTKNTLVKSLRLINRTNKKGQLLYRQILEILANSYKTEKTFCQAMTTNAVPPLERKYDKWNDKQAGELRKNTHQLKVT